MLEKENEYIQEVAKSPYVSNEEEIVSQYCRALEDVKYP